MICNTVSSHSDFGYRRAQFARTHLALLVAAVVLVFAPNDGNGEGNLDCPAAISVPCLDARGNEASVVLTGVVAGNSSNQISLIYFGNDLNQIAAAQTVVAFFQNRRNVPARLVLADGPVDSPGLYQIVVGPHTMTEPFRMDANPRAIGAEVEGALKRVPGTE